VVIRPEELAPKYRKIVEGCEPYLITYTGNLPSLDLAPFGLRIPEQNRFTPTSLKSRHAVDFLHRLDSFSFGPQEMLMPRWVLFDCGEFPGIVFGFGKKARDLDAKVRAAYQAVDDDVFVPLSMWVAIRCAEPDAWFGHNLSSVQIVTGDDSFAGMGTITKAFGMRLARIRKQYGATQWDSTSVGLHLTYGEMQLLSAYTPAHTHEETFSYLIDVDFDRIAACLKPGWKRPTSRVDVSFTGTDSAAIRALHERLEAGEKLVLHSVEGHGPTQRHLIRFDGRR
jgi:hypothetical protein